MSAVRATSRAPMARRMLALLGAVLLGGCATLKAPAPPAPVTPPAVDPHAAHLAALTSFKPWRLAGRIAVQREDKGFSADLAWREAGDDFSLRVAAPLNGGTYALSGNGRAVSLVSSKGDIFSAADAETLMQQHLGWALPLAGARYWVRGLPDPGRAVSAERLDASGRWTDFSQDGWHVSVTEYTHAAGRDLPKRLFLARDNFQVRMAIKTWEQR
ncbi:MAG: outer membrane lipoprotein LolB [Proteobacteria bacterium]|nr:outer membrane lipoprotein LolB [Pseudomonadota bacterium]